MFIDSYCLTYYMYNLAAGELIHTKPKVSIIIEHYPQSIYNEITTLAGFIAR